MNAKHIYPAFDATRTFTVDELLELTGRVAELEKQLAEARHIIRELSNMLNALDIGNESDGPLAEAQEFLSGE